MAWQSMASPAIFAVIGMALPRERRGMGDANLRGPPVACRSTTMNNDLYDCIVVGAGPAGLSAALFLARYRRRVLTFHHNSSRNEYAHGVHGFLGHHGISPAELLARGRDE